MGCCRERGSVFRPHYIVQIYGVLLGVWVHSVVDAAALRLPDRRVEAERLHAALHELADSPLRAVTHAGVQLLTFRDLAHVGDHVPACVGADGPAEKFPAVVQIVVHGRAALLVPLALPPSLRAARAGSPGQARLDGPLGARTHRVVGAAAVLQGRPAFGQVELH